MSAVLSLQGLTVALPRGADRPEALRQVTPFKQDAAARDTYIAGQ